MKKVVKNPIRVLLNRISQHLDKQQLALEESTKLG
jgi:hypothetical protein